MQNHYTEQKWKQVSREETAPGHPTHGHHLGCSLSPQKAKKIDPGTPCGPRLGVLLGEEGRAEGGEEVGSGGCRSERKAKVRGLRDMWLG